MRTSAGILLYRIKKQQLEVLLVHPGGPFWENKDKGAWSVPKGEYTINEDPLQAAIREMEEETGYKAEAPFIPLTTIKQKAGKEVMAWATEGDLDPDSIRSNTFKIEWPYKSGKWITVPEVDKAGWFSIKEAIEKINIAQVSFLTELHSLITNRNNTTDYA